MALHNSSLALPHIHFLSSSKPWYYSVQPQIIDGISDVVLALAAPLFAYWIYSLFFHFLDGCGWASLETYRIHESAEVTKRNRATKAEVVRAVLLQQLTQTVAGFWWIDSGSDASSRAVSAHYPAIQALAPRILRAMQLILGSNLSSFLWNRSAHQIVYYVYWWGIPIVQFFFAMVAIDTWQYVLHRGMHMNQFLYRKIHSVHHRLYVPYAFGALYNHPIEGFLLDSLGSVVAETVTAMTPRQAGLLFTIATLKTVDDHCGYRLPFDPFQLVTSNNADYHDIHHQIAGIKSNFAQPFFVHWDALLGTRMTREDFNNRKQKKPVDKKEL